MKRLVVALALIGSLGVIPLMPSRAGADLTSSEATQAILSCNDGHSVVMGVDPAQLTSLGADVQAVNSSGTGMSCTLGTSAIDPSSETSDWTVYDYNPSDRALAPRNSPRSLPATTTDGGVTWTFPFKPDTYTALFTTTDPSVTGNLTGETLTDTVTLNGDAASFMTQNGGGDCTNNIPAALRFYFTSPEASGPSTGSPPAGFYTKFWWSNPVHMDMVTGIQNGAISQSMSPTGWSDWNGQPATEFPATFAEAVSHVQSIGLSFGGDCFFETGVTPSGTFTNEALSSSFSVGP
jgi:hypothetical protein